MEPKSVHLGGIYENLVPYPLNFYTFDPIYVVTFLISCKILWILRGSWVNILCILCHLHSFRLGSGLVTELNQGHQHGQTESSDQNVEDPSHVAQAEGARLLLRECTRDRGQPGRGRGAVSKKKKRKCLKMYMNKTKSQPQRKLKCTKIAPLYLLLMFFITANIIFKKSTKNNKTNNK